MTVTDSTHRKDRFLLEDELTPEQRTHDELLRQAFRHNEPQPGAEPTVGALDLADRNAFRSVTGATELRSEEQTDGYEVEYRKLRLEEVLLVGAWTEGTTAEMEASMWELAALAKTAGADVLDMLYQKRDKPDPGTYIGSGKVAERARSCRPPVRTR